MEFFYMINKSNLFVFFLIIVMFFGMLGFVDATTDTCSVSLNSPNGGETLSGTNDISWTTSGNCNRGGDGSFTVSYSDDGSSWNDLSNVGWGTNSYSWDTTSVSDGDNYLVKVLVSPSGASDVSDNVFSISNSVPVCGDSNVDSGEVCDGNSQECSVEGYAGIQSCSSDCGGWNFCEATQSCGDGSINGNELCDDGFIFNGQEGFCNSDCSGQTCSLNFNQECSSEANSCGDTSSGIFNCAGVCNAETPEERDNWEQLCESSTNSCGDFNWGLTDCDGVCSAEAPNERESWNQICYSDANSCGDINEGTTQCDGSCNAVTPEERDCVSPTATILGNEGAYNFGSLTNGNVSVSLECNDKSGCSSIKYYTRHYDSVYLTRVVEEWVDYSEPILVSEDGTTFVYYQMTDEFGNQVEDNVEVRIDATFPTTSAIGYVGERCLTGDESCDEEYEFGTWTDGEVTVELSCSDGEDGSGEETIYYLVDGQVYDLEVSQEGNYYDGPFYVGTPGQHIVNYWCVDQAGNVEEQKESVVRILAQDNNGGKFEIPDGEGVEEVHNVTVHGTYTIAIPTGEGISYVTLEDGTVITRSNNESFGLADLSGDGNINLTALEGFESWMALGGAIQWGIPNLGLEFSKPINIKLYLGTAYDNQTLDVRRSVSGTEGWTQDGIEPPKTCVVSGGVCEFNATKASYYATTSGSAPAASVSSGDSGSSGSGGGSSDFVPVKNLLNLEESSNNLPEEVSPTANTNNPTGLAGITGAAIGALSKPRNLAILIVFVVLISGAAIYFIVKNRRANKKLKKK